jgi:Regulator of G protein signaling domain
VTQSEKMKELAMDVFDRYIQVGCENEVNIPSGMRNLLQSQLKAWQNEPVLSKDSAESVIKEDVLGVRHIFDPVTREIAKMLYMNIWNKFKTAETELQMGSNQV